MAVLRTPKPERSKIGTVSDYLAALSDWQKTHEHEGDDGFLSQLWYRGVHRVFDVQAPGFTGLPSRTARDALKGPRRLDNGKSLRGRLLVPMTLASDRRLRNPDASHFGPLTFNPGGFRRNSATSRRAVAAVRPSLHMPVVVSSQVCLAAASRLVRPVLNNL